MTLSVQTAKLLTALVIFLCGILSTTSPLFVAGTNEALFSAGNMMACGVLLAAGLVHQLADSAESLDQEDFPWSFFICGLTFILFLIFEESIHCLFTGEDHFDVSVMMVDGPTTRGSSCRGSIVIPGMEDLLLQEEEANNNAKYGASHDHSHAHDEQQPLKMKQVSSGDASINHRLSHFSHSSPKRASRLSIKVFGEPRDSVHHHHDDHISQHLHGSLIAALMLLMALSVHSVLAGLSIGIVSDVNDIYSTGIAIIAHKVFAGYALGSTMAAADLGYDRCVILGLVFSLSTPLGILIGMSLNSFQEDSSAIGIVKAIVAGTFLYVSIMEVGMKELLICRLDEVLRMSLSQKQLEAIKLASMLVGFLGMSYLAKFV